MAHYAFAMDDPRDCERFLGLPLAEFASPGPLREQLIEAILTGRKTSTTSLAHDYEKSGEALPHRGQRFAVVNSNGRRVAIIEVTGVAVVPLGEVELAHALREGHTSLAHWRAGHEAFWRRAAMTEERNDSLAAVDDTTPVVLERFTLVERLTEKPPARALGDDTEARTPTKRETWEHLTVGRAAPPAQTRTFTSTRGLGFALG
jgi:uncharacterized protein YhfF